MKTFKYTTHTYAKRLPKPFSFVQVQVLLLVIIR